jgi:hypothetical protein
MDPMELLFEKDEEGRASAEKKKKKEKHTQLDIFILNAQEKQKDQ